MAEWNTGAYADPILPEGNAVLTILSAKEKSTSGGTPFVSVMARVDEFTGEYDEEDESILVPNGQTAYGSIWLPKDEDDRKKALGKARRARAFVEAMIGSGADIKTEEYSDPVTVLLGNLPELIGKSFKSQIQHSVDPSGEYPTKAEISFFRVKRA